jgi:hypothetical protein
MVALEGRLVMGRWLRLSIAAIAVAAIFAGCAGKKEEAGTASPVATPARTAAPTVSAAPQATGTATAGRADGIPTVPAPVVTQQPPTPTPQPPTPTPTQQPPTPTPEPPTQEARQPQWTISQPPAEAQVQVVLDDGLGNAYIVASVDPEVTQWENWTVDHVGDLNADGIQDAIVLHYTGGAHCCFEYLIFSEGPSGIQLDDWFSLGNGGIGAVEDLDGDGVPELEASDDRLAYFPDLSFADSPFLPLVLCRTAEGTYTDCTTQFPDRMQAAADEFEAALSDAVQRGGEDYEKRSPALGLVTAYLLLAPTDEGWNKVASLCPECKDWLMQNYDELENRLAYVPPAPPMEPLPQ